MLPNKRNPDPAELVRGKTGTVIGQLTGVLATLKGLPLGYQRDLQEVKAPFFDACRTLLGSLEVLTGVIGTLTVDGAAWGAAAADGSTTAVSIADLLVDRGVAFRSAHHVAGRMVRAAEAAGTGLDELDDDAVKAALAASDDPIAAGLAGSRSIGAEVRAAAAVDAALARGDVIGGTAPSRVATELEAAARRLGLSL
jgi:argininosuccinate lyase